VLKDLGSKWDPSDRSGKWLKLKPDYIRAGSDLDVLIIGLYFNFFSSFHICLLQSNIVATFACMHFYRGILWLWTSWWRGQFSIFCNV
jgi:ATP-dependent DNA ligase